MSKITRATISTVIILAAMSLSTVALANVILDADGHPIGSMSNLGSPTAIESRSDWGTEMKTLHDGVRVRGSDY